MSAESAPMTRAMLALAEELDGEHRPGCCATGTCTYPDGQHVHRDDPIRVQELLGAWSDNPPPLREHRMIPCPGECNLDCPTPRIAARIRTTVAAVLAADPEPRGAVIERMARAMWAAHTSAVGWDALSHYTQADYRRLAAAALDARGGTQ